MNIYENETRFNTLVKKLNELIKKIEEKKDVSKTEEILLIKLYQYASKLKISKKNLYRNENLLKSFWFPGIPNQEILPKESINEIIRKYQKENYFSLEEIQIILDWIGYYIRIYMCNYLHQSFKTGSFNYCCWISSALSHESLNSLNLTNEMYDMSYFFKSISHEFCIAQFPIKENGHKEIRTYLIDYSYRQFFVSDFEYKNNFAINVLEKIENSLFSKHLIEKGYFELTPKTAIQYFQPFLYNPNVILDKNVLSHIPHKSLVVKPDKITKKLVREWGNIFNETIYQKYVELSQSKV